MNATRRLAALLRRPESAAEVSDWTGILTAAHAEALLGSLAWRLQAIPLPKPVERRLREARAAAARAQVHALWEAEMARRALATIGVEPILLKGTAYAAAGLDAARGRSIGDLDILVAEEALKETEAVLLEAGWEWVKPDPYDDLYYRRWMHELPPMIHRERDRMIDVHHTILPLTARPKPNAAALIAASVTLPDGSRVLAPTDMIVHAAAHLFADGDLAGGLRNLWDIACLLDQFGTSDFQEQLAERAELHQLTGAVARATRLAHRIHDIELNDSFERRLSPMDRMCEARLFARDGWGRPTRPWLRLGFYIRSHWLRMPPAMLARHLWIKAARKPTRGPSEPAATR